MKTGNRTRFDSPMVPNAPHPVTGKPQFLSAWEFISGGRVPPLDGWTRDARLDGARGIPGEGESAIREESQRIRCDAWREYNVAAWREYPPHGNRMCVDADAP